MGFAGAVKTIAIFIWTFTASMRAAQEMWGLLHPMCRLLQPLNRLQQLLTLNETNEDKDEDLRQRAKIGIEERERRQGAKTRN